MELCHCFNVRWGPSDVSYHRVTNCIGLFVCLAANLSAASPFLSLLFQSRLIGSLITSRATLSW